MDTLATVVGIGIYCFILLYIAFNLGKEHTIWKIFTILFVIVSLSLVAKISVDNYYVCDVYLINTTTPFAGSTVYSYDEICPLGNFKSGASFLQMNNVLLWIFMIYFGLFTLWTVTNGFLGLGKQVERLFGKR